MTISYNWLCRHLSEPVAPERLSKILTSIGLEVESLTQFSKIKGGLAGLVVGEVLTCEKHESADKLKVTTVNVGAENPLKIVCGAANVAVGQKVVVATVGTTIYPTEGEPFTIKKAKIRGEESEGMICAEDEIGLGTSHEGIMVLPADTPVGTAMASLVENYEDQIFEIGLTPNRMDAMSHLGVARDVMVYLHHHDKNKALLLQSSVPVPVASTATAPITVVLENATACKRYSGVSIDGITVAESPAWLKDMLLAIGVQPINNIVDITNFILHDTGQPLHAFDADKIPGSKIIVTNLKEGTSFTTLDGKERKLRDTDLIICDSNKDPLCMAGIYGGIGSGISNDTKNLFLESAWFSPSTIRKSSVAHGLRTDAASRFEKGVDISQTLVNLQKAAALIISIAGGELAGNYVDKYPEKAVPKTVGLKYHYLKKLSGKNYHGDAVKNILTRLGFVIEKDAIDELTVQVPLSKPDISLPADVVEEIMRIDGLDNIEIPAAITISPSVNEHAAAIQLKEKVANYLTGMGYAEIFTNSITNSKYYSEDILSKSVKMLNSLSAALDIMRPQMLQTGLEAIAYNKNRKNRNIRFYEFGKTYGRNGNKFSEEKHLSIYLSGNVQEKGWQQKELSADFFALKAAGEQVLQICRAKNALYEPVQLEGMQQAAAIMINKEVVAHIAIVDPATLLGFGIKEPVYYLDFLWEKLQQHAIAKPAGFKELPKFPEVQRDLAIIIDDEIPYSQVQHAISRENIQQLQYTQLFDVFTNEKLGTGKKSIALNFKFQPQENTLTDVEIDAMMARLLKRLQKDTGASIRQ